MATDKSPALDEIDRKILGVVLTDGRISITRLATQVGLSTSATSERLRRLETSGAIVGYRAEIAPNIDAAIAAACGIAVLR